MIIDGALQFTGTAGTISNDLPTTGTQQSTNVIDLAVARDMGVGDDPALKLLIQIMATFTVGTSLEVQLQGAPDSAGSPGSYTTMWDSGAIAEADLVAGRYIANIDIPETWLGTAVGTGKQALPRYLRLQYVTVGTHTTGAIFGSIILDRERMISYPPGIVIAN